MNDFQKSIAIKTEIKATFQTTLERPLTLEEQEYLDDMNTYANTISDKLHPAFRNLIMTMMDFALSPKKE